MSFCNRVSKCSVLEGSMFDGSFFDIKVDIIKFEKHFLNSTADTQS